VLHEFGGADGGLAYGGLVMDAKGDLYGTTYKGGPNCAPVGCGVVYELSPPAAEGGNWIETVLYSFGANASDGFWPLYGLTMDASGNLFGTTFQGGASCAKGASIGTVFKLTRPARPGSNWTETVLHSFCASGDGHGPEGLLVLDAAGAVYGTTTDGGAFPASGCCGTVFKLSPPAKSGGPWTEAILHKFGAKAGDGIAAGDSLILDAHRNLCVTTASGGGVCDAFCGAVFELSPPAVASGQWSETTLYSFGGPGSLGISPIGAMVMDAKGNLYGTNEAAGGGGNCATKLGNGCGAVFELSPPSQPGLAWTAKSLHSFGALRGDGALPFAGPILDPTGNLYGVAFYGGAKCNLSAQGCGVVFELSP